MDGVVALGNRGMTVEDRKEWRAGDRKIKKDRKDRKGWRALVHM